MVVDTTDAQDLRWANSDSAIMLWDSPLDSRILIVSAATGDMLQRFEPDVVGLGIKTLNLSATS